ncbi:MAG: hypothetical protein U0103_19800 [Candidatus Obscuribacterales bacterium]
MLQLIYQDRPIENRSDALHLAGTAGETIALKFDINSDATIDDFRVTVDVSRSPNSPVDFTDPGITQTDWCAETFVVKTWQSAGIGIYQAEAMLVDELLVKDDRLELKDSYRSKIQNWREILKPSKFYKGPEIASHKDARTKVLAGESKKFYARIKIPPHIKEGHYSAHITCQSGKETLQTIPVSIDIAPISLITPPHTFFLWYKGRLNPRCPQHFVSESLFRLQLQDIRDHGFNCISLTETDTSTAQRAINIAEEIGFEKIVLPPPFPELTKLCFKKAQPIIYLSDELDTRIEFPGSDSPEALIGHHQQNWKRARTVEKAKTLVSLVSHTFTKRLQNETDIGHCADIISLYLNRNREFFQFTEQLQNSTSSQFFYYWQCYMEKPNLNRVLAGTYLWKSGAAGISPYCYQHMPVYPNSPFNDFDEWEPDFHEGGINRPFKDHMTTYPSRDGIIPTLQWEALRDGITDFKYWFTLHHWLEKALASENREAREYASEARTRTNKILSRINLITISINSETELEPYQSIEPHEYDHFRNEIRNDIVALSRLLHT